MDSEWRLAPLREALFEGGNVAPDDDCEADEFEAGVWDERRDATGSKVFSREADEMWE